MSNSSIWLIDRTVVDATTPGQSEPRKDGKKGLFCIPQSSSITGASPSDCFVSYPVHSLGCLTPPQGWCWCILHPQLTELNEGFIVLLRWLISPLISRRGTSHQLQLSVVRKILFVGSLTPLQSMQWVLFKTPLIGKDLHLDTVCS